MPESDLHKLLVQHLIQWGRRRKLTLIGADAPGIARALDVKSRFKIGGHWHRPDVEFAGRGGDVIFCDAKRGPEIVRCGAQLTTFARYADELIVCMPRDAMASARSDLLAVVGSRRARLFLLPYPYGRLRRIQ